MRISDWSSDVCSSDLAVRLHHRIMRLVEEGEALADPRAAGEAIVADDVAGEARRAAEPRGHSVAALIEHRRAIGRFDHVGHMAGRRDVGDTYGHAIVEQVEYLADQDGGLEGDRLDRK